jgi:catechol 2,3-dioxygenase-like lactoylglutathione lyase family enzyme
MQVTSLFHVAIKTPDLDATVKFYTEVLGMELANRPNFGFPGAWLAQPGGPPIIHIYAGSASRWAPTARCRAALARWIM